VLSEKNAESGFPESRDKKATIIFRELEASEKDVSVCCSFWVRDWRNKM
jgi:hypothetical protein